MWLANRTYDLIIYNFLLEKKAKSYDFFRHLALFQVDYLFKLNNVCHSFKYGDLK
jgi:hypothetical protein